MFFSAIAFLDAGNPDHPLFLMPFVVFLGAPILDAHVGLNVRNPREDQIKHLSSSRVWMPALYLCAFTQFLVLALGAYSAMRYSWLSVVGLSFVAGIYTGGFGITVAHELCHKTGRSQRFSRLLADWLLASVCYQHFAIEHVRGHHLHVSTPVDPASARRDESIYAFLPRTLIGSFRHALELEKNRLGKTWHWRNQALRGIAFSLGFAAIAAFLGIKVLIYFLLQSLVGIILLEIVNYVEHYGLNRKALSNGRFEKVTHEHSWNASHLVSNAILFNLQRHSDHHANAHLPFTILKHHDDSPQLPSGYPAMVILALWPAIWFKIMNPRLDRLAKTKPGSQDLAS